MLMAFQPMIVSRFNVQPPWTVRVTVAESA